jgi:GxxExxY protein
MTENELAARVLEAGFQIHRRLGPGLLESAYLKILAHILRKEGLDVATEVAVPIEWDGIVLEAGFRADLIIEGKLIVELKSVEKLAPVHTKQVLTYLRLTNMKLGLLINFGEALLKDGIHRVANGMPD